MSSLRQHFQRIKEIVDWSWTLALLCLIGYITLGQLAQLYWAMLFLGGVAGSFGLFYEFSCQKLVELDFLDAYELQKANVSATEAQFILRKFSNRNPRITNQHLDFIRAREQVNNTKEKSYTRFQDIVNQQRHRTQQKPSQPSQKTQTPPTKQPPLPSSTQARSIPPTTPKLTRASKARLTLGEYRYISNQNDYEFVRGYLKRNGTWVDGYYRRKRRK
ncbi:SMODS and SLOG-associating 2TM effector domain-containing protein [Nostoc sp. DSM 114161]|jgi:hypothetical protein|uniref:hypothetical protein n=1 Tax=Nostoc sp. DSM 114161 TaxID=3440143 RepID=UPI004045A0E1